MIKLSSSGCKSKELNCELPDVLCTGGGLMWATI